MRIISVNVNGIQAAAERGLLSWLQAQNADVICLQDTRASAFDLDDPSFHADLLLGVSLILFENKGPDFVLHTPKNEA